jgi:hypothetical protein
MKGINLGRVIQGGLLAGILINISEFLLNEKVLKSENDAVMKALGKTMPEGGSTLVVWTVLSFAIGIASVWLYAAIRPRYGAGPGTAARAGLAVWFFTALVTMVVMNNMGLVPINGLALIWTLVQSVLTTVLGAWLYKEEGAAA